MCDAATIGDLPNIKELINSGFSMNKPDVNGNSPLIIAIKNKHLEVAKYLIEAGCDIDQDNKFGDSAFSLSKDAELEEITMLLNIKKESVVKRQLTSSAPVSKSTPSEVAISAIEIVISPCEESKTKVAPLPPVNVKEENSVSSSNSKEEENVLSDSLPSARFADFRKQGERRLSLNTEAAEILNALAEAKKKKKKKKKG